MDKMIILDNDKQIGDIKYHCIKCNDVYRIWECRYANKTYYEAHLRTFLPCINFQDNIQSAHEVFPSAKAFGRIAWTYESRDKAEARANTLSKHSSWKHVEQ